jgi:hypothetical protein
MRLDAAVEGGKSGSSAEMGGIRWTTTCGMGNNFSILHGVSLEIPRLPRDRICGNLYLFGENRCPMKRAGRVSYRPVNPDQPK